MFFSCLSLSFSSSLEALYLAFFSMFLVFLDLFPNLLYSMTLTLFFLDSIVLRCFSASIVHDCIILLSITWSPVPLWFSPTCTLNCVFCFSTKASTLGSPKFFYCSFLISCSCLFALVHPSHVLFATACSSSTFSEAFVIVVVLFEVKDQ